MSLEALLRRPRRKIFVSYHHGGDQHYYNELSRIFHLDLEAITDNSLSRQVQSDDPEYVMRRIRELHLTGSSCTIVLCGINTPGRKFVDWEIMASLNQGMGLVGIWLPTLPLQPNGGTHKPKRLQDNIDSQYALWISWDQIAARPATLLESIEAANSKSSRLIDNSAPRMTRNA